MLGGGGKAHSAALSFEAGRAEILHKQQSELFLLCAGSDGARWPTTSCLLEAVCRTELITPQISKAIEGALQALQSIVIICKQNPATIS